MDIFILNGGIEEGPFSWVDIAVKLHQGEIEEITSLQIDGISKPLIEWGLWSEGIEIGPLTWDEVSQLLSAGVVKLDTPAVFEGESRMTILREVIRRSREVSLEKAKISPSSESSPSTKFSQFVHSLPLANKVAVACGVILCCALLALFLGRQPGIPARSSKPNVLPPAGDGPTTVAVPLPATTTAASLSDPEPAASQPSPEPAPSLSTPALATPTSLAQISSVPEEPAPVVASSAPVESPKGAPSAAADSNSTAANVPPPPASTPTITQQNPPLRENSPPKTASQPSATPAKALAPLGDFFQIESVQFLKKPTKEGIGVWTGDPKKPAKTDEFIPCLEVRVSAKENTRPEKLIAKAYFYDSNNKLLASSGKPSKAGSALKRDRFEMPSLFYKEKADSIFFAVPDEVRNEKKWKAVIVFGDKQELRSTCFPRTESDFLLTYPEKEMVHDRSRERVARKPAMDPLIEYVVKTRNPKMPQMTLFLRPPKNISDSSEIRGVMALCLLAGSLEEVRQELRKEEMTGDYNGSLAFADQNKLAILAWGANNSLWARANYDELTKKQARTVENSFSIVADAWERGVLELGEKYGMPTRNFLLQGQCGSAHLAKALCLAKPQYFLAIHIHIPGFFEPPTPEASRVLWCITTGELYYSYDYSLRFLADAKKMGYPILYKAFVGLGHAGHPDARAMGQEFFRFALTQQELIEEHEKKKASAIDSLGMPSSQEAGPWLEAFKHPPMYGDIINQEVYPADQVDMIPEGFRIPIPTKELAAIWKKNR